jgi:hypothetical protein
MFVIKFDDTWFKFLEKTSFRFVPRKHEATIFNDYAHAESVVKSLAQAGINKLTVCVHRAGRPKIPFLRVVK